MIIKDLIEKYGECYTSRQIHNDFGFGYAVCPKCYEMEWEKEWEKAKRNYKAIEEVMNPPKKIVKITEESDRIIVFYDDGSWEWKRAKG